LKCGRPETAPRRDARATQVFANIAPGSYKLFAWTDIEPNAWQSADVMRQYEGEGVAITITEGATASSIVTAIE
jgi:hypothetical protein